MTNPTCVIIFSKTTLAAVSLALNPSESVKVRKEAEKAAYSNARALGRAALAYLGDK